MKFDFDFDKKKHPVKQLRELRSWMKKNIADHPCEWFMHGCIVCETWLALHRLEQLLDD